MTSWGEASGSQAGEGSATGRQSDGRLTREEERGEGQQENGNTELGLEKAGRTDTNWVVVTTNWHRLDGDPRLK